MFENLRDSFGSFFYDWNTMSFIVWIALSFGSIYVAWFVNIPSALGDSGIPFTVKIGITVVIPIVAYFMIQNKEWTANTFRKRSKR